MNTPMTSHEIRASFLDFFRSKQHEIVPSASLMPTSPNLLFTNAGMNQFVPYFLGDRKAPYPRAADTQKCIRAGGKHNDLDDVGFDTYHQTFFEMLGNWSFGDYFKKEAIEWAWELLVDVWKFPTERLYITVYQPGEDDPAAFDHEAHAIWTDVLTKSGLDPAKHIRTGGKADNFWMMGNTGPCGPCSEIHIDLTEKGDTEGVLVNDDSAYCMEIWNLVFIQFNANEDGTFSPLSAQHVDTGMGFERIAGIMATTKGFTEYGEMPSNYNSDVFEPVFEKLTELCGHTYARTLPEMGATPTEAEMKDVVFRVLADHIRTLCCSIADGILPGNSDRNYVLRRILRRAVMYGRRLDLPSGFFTQLAEPVIGHLGPVFPELVEHAEMIQKVLASEERSFDRTIDRGIGMLERLFEDGATAISGEQAFELYDTYGFPLDLTEILAGEKKVTVDVAGFEACMEKQRETARDARTTTVIKVAEGDAGAGTQFVGYEAEAIVGHESTVVAVQDGVLITESSPFYAEMGGQVGDSGTVSVGGNTVAVTDTQKDDNGRFLHQLGDALDVAPGDQVTLSVDGKRRRAIERHHSATHVLHWALREVVGTHVQQAGSFVSEEALRFDFNHFEQVKPEELAQIEALCNQRLLGNDPVRWEEVPFDDKPEDVIAFFGDKYGDVVRVVDIGGWSKELCGGTHVRYTGEIGPIRLVSESSISSGVRRIEAVCGEAAQAYTTEEHQLVRGLSALLSSAPGEIAQRVDQLMQQNRVLEKSLKELSAGAAAGAADNLKDHVTQVQGLRFLTEHVAGQDMDALRTMLDRLREQDIADVIVLGGDGGGKAALVAAMSQAALGRGAHAGKLLKELAGMCGGGGGGRPDKAQAGGKNADAVPGAVGAAADLVAGQLG